MDDFEDDFQSVKRTTKIDDDFVGVVDCDCFRRVTREKLKDVDSHHYASSSLLDPDVVGDYYYLINFVYVDGDFAVVDYCCCCSNNQEEAQAVEVV